VREKRPAPIPSHSRVRTFRQLIWRHYRETRRDLPWRKTRNPYRIFVSEIMLQQTQVERVSAKYREFVKRFPDFHALAKAPLHEILMAWQGLGYNRRAVGLKKAAMCITDTFGGRLPSSEKELLSLPGVGKYTASALIAFVFNKPSIFIETNIRRVFLHFFFEDREGVSDTEIIPLLTATLDHSAPREWYYALMDYGVMLRAEVENPNRRSAHYRRQGPFKGSNRQARGMILRLLLKESGSSESEIARKLGLAADVVVRNVAALEKEGFLERRGKRILRVAS
jgi:A/G-specific adenine glycosylase